VLERQPDGTPTWHILPPDARTAQEAVKLASPAIMLSTVDKPVEPLTERLVCMPGSTSPVAPVRSTPPPGTQFSLLENLPSPRPANPVAPPAPAIPATAVEPHTPTPRLPATPDSLQPPPEPEKPHEPTAPPFKLIAPMRLNPAVRTALSAIVDTLNGPAAAAAAAAVDEGLFVPLRELERRGIQPALAARALADTGLLVRHAQGRPATVTEEFAGEPTVGLVLAPAVIEGFELGAFLPAPGLEP